MSILCPCVMCQDLKNGHRLTLKSPLPTPPTRKLFLVSNERYGQINTFLLRCYGTDFASIKRYDQFCFLLLYIRRHRFSLYSLYSSLPISFQLSHPSLCSLSLLSPQFSTLYPFTSLSLLLYSLFSLHILIRFFSHTFACYASVCIFVY